MADMAAGMIQITTAIGGYVVTVKLVDGQPSEGRYVFTDFQLMLEFVGKAFGFEQEAITCFGSFVAKDGVWACEKCGFSCSIENGQQGPHRYSKEAHMVVFV